MHGESFMGVYLPPCIIRSALSNFAHVKLLEALPHTCTSLHGMLPIHGQAFMGCYSYMYKHSWEFTHTLPSIHGSLPIHDQAFMGV